MNKKYLVLILLLAPVCLMSQSYSYLGKHFLLQGTTSVNSTLLSFRQAAGLFSATDLDVVDLFYMNESYLVFEYQPSFSVHYIVSRRLMLCAGYTFTRPLVHSQNYPGPYLKMNGALFGVRFYNYGRRGFLAPVGKYLEVDLLRENMLVDFPDSAISKPYQGLKAMGSRLQVRWGWDFPVSDRIMLGMGVNLSTPIINDYSLDFSHPLFSTIILDYARAKMLGTYLTVGVLL